MSFVNNKIISALVLIVSITILFFALSTQAIINKQINYQGKLFNSNEQPVNDGDYNMEFRLCVTSDCTDVSDPIWVETRTNANKVSVKTGLFSVLLGEVSSIATVDFSQDLWLGVNIGGIGSPSWDGEMIPRKKLGSVNASIVSASLKSDVDGNEIIANSANNLLEITQSGSGDIFRVNDTLGDVSPFLIDANGNVGVGDDTPDALLDVAGSFRLDGTFGDKDGDSGTMGQVLSSTATGIDWITNSTNPIPYISTVNKYKMSPSTTGTFTLEGVNFTPTTAVSITNPTFTGTIDSVNVLSPTEMEVTVTSSATEELHDIVLSNSGVLNTAWTGNGVDLFEVATSTWKDLRSGGDSFTDGNGAGNDIRYRSGMSMSRDANGMYFSGASPWSSWVKFESLGWTRGTNQTVQWIFTNPDGGMMIGIGSDATNETSTAQYAQAEVEAYFDNSTNMWGLYGNNGTVGSAGNQSNSTAISSGGVYKIKFENDGDAGDTFTLYQIPSAAPGDWDNETNVITTFSIGGSLHPDETNIMPFIIPRNGGTQRFIAVKVE